MSRGDRALQPHARRPLPDRGAQKKQKKIGCKQLESLLDEVHRAQLRDALLELKLKQTACAIS